MQKLTVNGGMLELATASADAKFGVLYTAYGGSVNTARVINIVLAADRRMMTGKNTDGTDAVVTEAADKTAIGTAKYVYIAGKHEHCVCGGTAYDGHDSHTITEWLPWTAADKLPDKAGSYYLVNDVTLADGTAALPDGVNLCLNGKAVRGAGADYTELAINGAMTVTDCGAAGSLGDFAVSQGNFTMTGNAGTGGVLQINDRTDFTMTGHAQNNNLIILKQTSEEAKIVFGGSSGGIGRVSISQPRYGTRIRVEGSAKLVSLEGEILNLYIGLTMQGKAEATVDILGFRALSMSGGSVLHGKVTGADDSSYFTMGDDARIDGDIDVGDSRVDGKAICTGNIISGVFNDEVVNNGRITGGIFYGTVSGTGVIEDSARAVVSFDSDGGSCCHPEPHLYP